MILNDHQFFTKSSFTSESELESVLWKYSKYFFGSTILILPKAKIKTISGSGTIPDGFVIDFQNQSWYVVEAEIASHGVWTHIAPQISKQLTAIEHRETKEKLLDLAIKEIKSIRDSESFLDELNLKPIDVPGVIKSILNKPPVLALPIDEIPPDLTAWVNTIRYSVSIWLVEKYVNEESGEILYSIPDELLPSVSSEYQVGKVKNTVVLRFSQPYHEVMSDGYWKEGDIATLEYGPRSKPKTKFTGILRKEGIEVDGKVMSLSAAAVYCIKKTGSNRDTANGWVMWRNADGVLLSDFFNQHYSGEKQE